MTTTSTAATLPWWRHPLTIISIGCLISLVSFGVRSSFGLFLAPMSMEFGWGREVFATAIAIQNLMWGIGQPFAGALADRYGAGRVLSLGAVCYALGLYLMADATTPTLVTLSGGFLVGTGVAGASFSIILACFGRMVPTAWRSTALGLGTAAGSLGQMLYFPLGQAFINSYGWSLTLVIFASMVLLIIPCATVLAGRPEHGADVYQQSITEALREAFAHSSYWYLLFGFFVCGFHVAFIQTHFPAYLTDRDMAPTFAALALAVVGGFNIIGSLSSGVLGGRYSKRYLLSSLYLGRAVVIAVFISLPITETSVLLFSAAMGLLWLSTVPLTSGLVAQLFGPRYMATLFGIVFFSHQLGAFLGVWLGGYVFDTTGDYRVVWWISIGLGIFAALIHWPIREQAVVRPASA